MFNDLAVVWLRSCNRPCNDVPPGHAHYFDFQLITCRNISQHSGQTHVTCCAQQCCHIVAYAVSKCCDRLAGACK